MGYLTCVYWFEIWEELMNSMIVVTFGYILAAHKGMSSHTVL